jgi:hypothetical protein
MHAFVANHLVGPVISPCLTTLVVIQRQVSGNRVCSDKTRNYRPSQSHENPRPIMVTLSSAAPVRSLSLSVAIAATFLLPSFISGHASLATSPLQFISGHGFRHRRLYLPSGYTSPVEFYTLLPAKIDKLQDSCNGVSPT